MKKIALIADGWKRLVTYSWVDGIIKQAESLGIDICLYYFSSNGNWSHDKKFNDGEYVIYSLPELDGFDGIIFDCSNMVDREQIESIVGKLEQTRTPVVSIAYDMEGFYYVGNDNKRLFTEMIDHLYKHHNCRSFVYAGGPEGQYENTVRLEAFKEAMESYGIPVTDDMYMSGDYDFATGVRYMKEWQEEKREFPDAFVCANDNIAAGICSEAARYGYSVPGDFLVTGCDNLDKAAFFSPQITTIESNRGRIGQTAMQILVDLWEGRPVEKYHYLQSDLVYGESCGCPNNGRVDYRRYAKEQIEYQVAVGEQEEAVMTLQNAIEECVSYNELYEKFAKYVLSLDCDGLYIITDKELVQASIHGEFPSKRYNPDNLMLSYAEEKQKDKMDVRTLAELKTYMESQPGRNTFMLCSIHFRDGIVGCTVLRNPRFLYDNADVMSINSTFVTRLEDLYRQRKLEVINEELKNIYNRDALTGLYNRVAYTEMVMPRFKNLTENGTSCSMIFFDVDGFKQINDTKGHKYGDEVLKEIADTLEREKPVEGFVYRFGGDEFVLFYPHNDERVIRDFIEKVSSELKKSDVSISYGIIVTDPSSGRSLDEYIVMADKEMYKIKQAKKAKHKYNFFTLA